MSSSSSKVSQVKDIGRKAQDAVSSANPDRHYVFVIAVLLVGAFVIFYGITMYVEGSTNEYQGIEKVTTSLSPLIGAIIGFYFGNRPVQQVARQAVQEAKEKEQMQQELSELYQRLAAANRLIAKKNEIADKTRKIVDMVDEAIE